MITIFQCWDAQWCHESSPAISVPPVPGVWTSEQLQWIQGTWTLSSSSPPLWAQSSLISLGCIQEPWQWGNHLINLHINHLCDRFPALLWTALGETLTPPPPPPTVPCHWWGQGSSPLDQDQGLLTMGGLQATASLDQACSPWQALLRPTQWRPSLAPATTQVTDQTRCWEVELTGSHWVPGLCQRPQLPSEVVLSSHRSVSSSWLWWLILVVSGCEEQLHGETVRREQQHSGHLTQLPQPQPGSHQHEPISWIQETRWSSYQQSLHQHNLV